MRRYPCRSVREGIAGPPQERWEMERLRLAFRGDFQQAGMKPPLVPLARRRAIAAAAGDHHQAEFPDPFDLAQRRRIEIIRCDAQTMGRHLVLVLPPSTVGILDDDDQGRRGLRAFRGIATVELLRHEARFVVTDVFLLAADLALPPSLIETAAPPAQPWVPPWFVDFWTTGLGAPS